MKNPVRFAVLAIAAVTILLFGGCLKIETIDKPEDTASVDPVPETPPETPPETEPPVQLPPEEITVDEELLADAVALAVAGSGTQYIEEADGLWNAVGWYAALNARVSGAEGAWLSEGTCDALSAILHPEGDPPPFPAGWLNDGVSRETRDGRAGLLFYGYEKLLGETLGVWRELSQTVEDGTRIIAVTDHLEEGVERFLVYVAFETDPRENQRRMVYLVMTDPIRELELNFTLDDVRERNRISKLLTAYSCVTVDMSDEYGTAYQSFWLRDGDRVYYEADETEWTDEEGNPYLYHSENGSYRGISFNTYLAAEPTAYLWVTAQPEDHTNEAYYENYISSYLPATESLVKGPWYILDSADDVTFGVTENYQPPDVPAFEINHIVTVDKSTLAVREYRMEYVMPDGSEYAGGFTVSYNGEKLGEDVMKAWDACRTVTLDMKTEAGGERSETVKVPDGWFLNLLADEGVTVYADEALTEMTYNYVDGGTGDITLYARDEANTVSAKIDISSVTLENVLAANYITMLTKQYGQVKIHMRNMYGMEDTWYFRSGASVTEVFEWFSVSGDKTGATVGLDGSLTFEIGEDGAVSAYGYPAFLELESDMPDERARYTDKDGEYYAMNNEIIASLFGGTLDELAETDVGYTFRVSVARYADAPPDRYRCTADKRTLALTELKSENSEYTLTMEYGEDLTPYAGKYAEAMKKTRTITYHATFLTYAYDCVYTVPADWEFRLSAPDMTFYADAGYAEQAENLVPADGKDHEYWISDGTHTMANGGLPFTLEQIVNANRVTALLRKYGQIFIRTSGSWGTNDSQFFQHNGTIIYAETLSDSVGAPGVSGTIGEDAFFRTGQDGKTYVSIYADEVMNPPDPRLTDTDGSTYMHNYFFLWYLDGAEPAYVGETADTVTFSAASPLYMDNNGNPLAATYTVDRASLTILSVETQDEKMEITCGENAAPYASVYAAAMADSRMIACHNKSGRFTHDVYCYLPSAWEAEVVLTVYSDEQSPFFSSSEEMNQPVSNVIPAYSGDVEIWCAVAVG